MRGVADVSLREVTRDDLDLLFEHQRDPEARQVAAFTPKDPSDRAAFDARWERFFRDATIVHRAILVDDRVVGSVLKFVQDGKPEVTYWIAREHWGRGIATSALGAFLRVVDVRPLYARAATDNLGSIRVLEKCGFRLL